jgi:signal transduction histidine kinase
MSVPHRVVVLALPGVYPFELGIPNRVLGAADGRYELVTCGVGGTSVPTNSDFGITVEHGPEALVTADTVVIPPFDVDRLSRELSPELSSALDTIRHASREAMSELRATISLLRTDGDRPALPSALDLDQLKELIARFRRDGLDVDMEIRGTVRPLPAATNLTIYRIVQESLTNVVRHACASAASVWLQYLPTAVQVRVEDNGAGPASHHAAGYGLLGMRERAEALGGCLEVGPAPAGGFRVTAQLPTAKAPS